MNHIKHIKVKNHNELASLGIHFIKGKSIFLPFDNVINEDNILKSRNISGLIMIEDSKSSIPYKGKIVLINKRGINKGYAIQLETQV